MQPAGKRRRALAEALRMVGRDVDLCLAYAKSFWASKKADQSKAKEWILNALELDKANADVWAHLMLYETTYGTPATQA